MVQKHAGIADFFSSFARWKADTHDELVNDGAYCLTGTGRMYAAYVQHGGDITVK
jgi:hypothetical protein